MLSTNGEGISTHSEDILVFIRDFESSSRDYLQSKGFSENEMTNAYLDLQWSFLHTILKQQAEQKPKNPQRHILFAKKQAG